MHSCIHSSLAKPASQRSSPVQFSLGLLAYSVPTSLTYPDSGAGEPAQAPWEPQPPHVMGTLERAQG